MPPAFKVNSKPLHERIVEAPLIADEERAEAGFDALRQAISGWADDSVDIAALRDLVERPQLSALLRGCFSASRHLSPLIQRDLPRLMRCLSSDPDRHIDGLCGSIARHVGSAASEKDAMRRLREFKNEAALTIALADLGGVWPIMRVTRALSQVADCACQAALDFLFLQAAQRGEYTPADPEHPGRQSGYIVLAMGKHGARELNYSSDIDLIVLYEPGVAKLREGAVEQQFFIRVTRSLVRLLQERTGDGYVFRCDLRLRPDPGSTQVALSTPAAMHYYEVFGQNWERAAMIKARPAAGDLAAGERFQAQLQPFIWRKYLDYATIADIHAMKRQIHAFKGFGAIGVAGHNVKLGRGGIREIEFFAQTQQLIAGGRQFELRERQTLAALEQLQARDWISKDVAVEMAGAYRFLRRIEHRIQMIADEQTHLLPASDDKLFELARFSGFATLEEFAESLRWQMERVQRHYGELFEDVPDLSARTGNLVFTGDDDDPQTLESLRRLGYENPSAAIAIVKGWHFGRYAAVRSERARQRLTEFQPILLEALSEASSPDLALASFDKFLSELPAGIQLFSLLRSNPHLLRLVADIMGTAPRLARILSKRRRVLDAVLDPGFFGRIPSKQVLSGIIEAESAAAIDYQDLLDRARIVGREQAFLIGVRVLSGTITPEQAGITYANLAETLLRSLQTGVVHQLEAKHGRMQAGALSIIAMGKLGGGEMTATSDLDLITVYDFDDAQPHSDGTNPLAGNVFFARATQRLITAVSSQTAEGSLYEVDMRLRPSGNSGPVATRLASFVDYQRDSAWTWEHMALCRARVVTGPKALRARIEATIRSVLLARRDADELVRDVHDMRLRIAREKGSENIWNLKQVRGGLVDLEFLAQFLQLRHAHDKPQILDPNTIRALAKLTDAGCLPAERGERLVRAGRLLHALSQVLALCLVSEFSTEAAPDGLKSLLAQAGEAPNFASLEADLRDAEAQVCKAYEELIERPAT